MHPDELRDRLVGGARRLVVKIGTAVITSRSNTLDARMVSHLAGQVAALTQRRLDVAVVSSGAVGAGMGLLGLSRRPRHLPELQAAAAVGQSRLMRVFKDALKRRGLHAAQLLVTRQDFENRTSYVNIRNTIHALHRFGAIPIINENDSVAVEELERRFGDNDIIAAQTANLLRADLLVLLTRTDGVLAEGRRIDVVHRVDAALRRIVSGGTSALGSGGMASKIEAARMVTESGEAAIIAPGRRRDVLLRMREGEPIGTLFVPTAQKLSSRKRWIGLAARAAGTLVLDDGAVAALGRGKSLLPGGIAAVEGRWGKGSVVDLSDRRGRRVARGITNYTAAEIDRIKGLRTGQVANVLGDCPYAEVIHRDNLTLAEAGGPRPT